MYKYNRCRFYTKIHCYNGETCCQDDYTTLVDPKRQLVCAPPQSSECDWREESDGMSAGIIVVNVLVVIVILILLAAAVFCLLGGKCNKVFPNKTDDIESNISLEDDEETQQIGYGESLLDEGIATNDMASLKIALQYVENYELQAQLHSKYRKAAEVYDILFERSEAMKKEEFERIQAELEMAKKELDDREQELERLRKEETEKAALEVQRKRDLAKSRWKKLHLRWLVLRTILEVGETAKAKKEAEKDKLKIQLKKALSTLTYNDLQEATSNVDKIGQADSDDLHHLYQKAKAEMKRIKEERRQRKAEAILKLADIRKILITAIDKREVRPLQSSIDEVESNGLSDELTDELRKAKELLTLLKKRDKVWKAIQEMSRPLIAELRSFSDPPVPVFKTMIATFRLLGYENTQLSVWREIVILLNKTGKQSIKRRVQEFEAVTASLDLVDEVSVLLNTYSATEVFEANQAAGLFYDWIEMVAFERKTLDSLKV